MATAVRESTKGGVLSLARVRTRLEALAKGFGHLRTIENR